MKSNETLKFAGDVNIDKIRIITPTGFFQDIAAQVINIQIFEDLFSPFISGSLILKESLDLINLFPFIGEEYLELEVSTPTLDKNNIKGKYYIYKMTNREMVGDRSMVYQLHFISVEAIADLNKKVSKSFAGKVSDIVSKFVKDKYDGLESSKQLYVEPSLNSTKYVSNFWTPVQNITYLCEQAINQNKTPDYVFFENRDGFYFISLESLYGGPLFQEFVYDKYTRDELPGGGSIRNVEEDYKRILDINIPVGFDYMDRIRSGMLSSKLITYDVTKKTYATKNYNMFQRFEQQKHLNKFPINSSKSIFRSNAAIFVEPKANANMSGFGDTTNTRSLQERFSLMKLAEANKLEITVPGRADYTVGQKISVILNKIEPLSKKDGDTTDKMFSGYYLISAINHYITKENHECVIEVIKESSQMNMNVTSR
jgi:hypothetical protein